MYLPVNLSAGASRGRTPIGLIVAGQVGYDTAGAIFTRQRKWAIMFTNIHNNVESRVSSGAEYPCSGKELSGLS